MSEKTYTKVEVDNPVCQRRFHIAWEENSEQKMPRVKVACPHCGDIVFERENHHPAILVREENLIHAPTGDKELMAHCSLELK